MSSVNDPTNIVDFGSHQDPRNERVGNLLESVHQISARHLKKLADSMFERVDDTLFDLAEKAESNAVQTQYFDGMREVRKKRSLTERQFQSEVRRILTDFATGRSSQTQGGMSTGAGSHGELSLVDDTELEESLAIASMTSKAQSRLSRQLYAVNQRLSVICGGNKVEDSNNPLGPTMLCEAFRQSMRELDVETRVRLIIYKLFDRYVMAGLGELYTELNHQLARAGVLPKLHHELPGQSRAASRQHSAGAGAASAGAGSVEDADFQAEFYQTLNTLLSSRRGEGSGYVSGAAGLPSLSPAELLGALSLLQNEMAIDTVTHADQMGGTISMQDIAKLKAHLLKQVGRLRGDAKVHMSGADEDTIDLVGMLFEFILEDRNLPVEMQVLLARLQIPYLKAAILDRRMFAHTTHPARRLLDALAEAAKGWSEESDRDRRLYAKVHGIVETLLQEFDDDMDIFSRLEQELADFQAASRKRAELSEQRVAEAVRGREKLQQARRRAAKEILVRLNEQALPELIRSILTRAWANYLVLTLLRQGEESQEFRVALRFVDDFIWSALPKQDEAERERLRKLLPLLEKSLRHGLATVAFQDADVESLMAQLNTMYRVQLGEIAPPADLDEQADASKLIPDSVETIASPEVLAEAEAEAVEAGAKTARDAANPDVQRVRELKVGDWLEFSTKDKASGERAKLSWISPISGKYLFVNRRGLKVADKTVTELARELADGSAIVLEELPLFDRALDAIVERLRQTQAKRGQQTENDDTPQA
ncbi:MAG TPA: DUF1631 domain-containing protein [Rhodanobacteraceae bacterium]|nr:DUF1631 domain-containing protein [Rhodanobacteraceae bacterium]